MESANQTKQEIERGIYKSHRKQLWTPFLHAIQDFKLIEEGDRVAVCVSGGKDSLLLASLFGALERVSSVPFSVKYICMDPGYPAFERACVEESTERLGIELHIFESDVFEQVRSVDKGQCYLCARMRRGHLYKEAQRLGCNKIALAHHYNDVVETILMGMLYGAQVQTMMPKLRSKNFAGMELIRPLYYVREKDIIAFRDRHKLPAIRCGCPLLSNCDTRERTAKARGRTKAMITELKAIHPTVEECIFRSVQNVNLSTIIGYHKDGLQKSFLDDYENAVNDDD